MTHHGAPSADAGEPGRLAAGNRLWQQCWRDKQTDFHQTAVNPLLMQCWPGLALAAASRVFVPLCGKSLDLKWLLSQGHHVIGVELSPLAVRAYFRERKLQPVRQVLGNFVLWSHGRLGILCGDFFSLTPEHLHGVQAVYDRAALTALPESLRQQYAAHLMRILPADFCMLLLTTEEAEAAETEIPPLSPEIQALYGGRFNIALCMTDSRQEQLGMDADLTQVDYKVYALQQKMSVPA